MNHVEKYTDFGIIEKDPRFLNDGENNDFLSKYDNGLLKIDDWKLFTDTIKEIYDEVKINNEGNVASYIPQLANINPELFGICVVSVDGQVYRIGDFDNSFCIQSCSKPITYGLALKEHSEAIVHNFVGMEPSGRNFNELCLNEDNLPHNPLINSGAIMTTSLIKSNKEQSNRFEYIYKFWKDCVANTYLSFDNSVYLSEKDTADRNKCLGFMMQEKKAFKKGKNKKISKKIKRKWNNDDLQKTLELYFQNCSIKTDLLGMGLLSGMLANGGIHPWTNKTLFSYKDVKKILSIMLSCGMYDYSGEWCYKIGIPAKSGVSGLIYGVIPGVCGIAVYSPKLDKLGNSFRGIEFFKKFVKKVNSHIFENRLNNYKLTIENPLKINNKINGYLLLDAAFNNDCDTIRNIIAKGINVNYQDYDKRTALHIASNENNKEAIELLIENGADTNLLDRWNNIAHKNE